MDCSPAPHGLAPPPGKAAHFSPSSNLCVLYTLTQLRQKGICLWIL